EVAAHARVARLVAGARLRPDAEKAIEEAPARVEPAFAGIFSLGERKVRPLERGAAVDVRAHAWDEGERLVIRRVVVPAEGAGPADDLVPRDAGREDRLGSLRGVFDDEEYGHEAERIALVGKSRVDRQRDDFGVLRFFRILRRVRWNRRVRNGVLSDRR